MVVEPGLTRTDHPCLPRIDHHITEYEFDKRRSKHSKIPQRILKNNQRVHKQLGNVRIVSTILSDHMLNGSGSIEVNTSRLLTPRAK